MPGACEEAASFIDGRKREDLGCDVVLLRALTQSIQIIGEAAARLDPGSRRLHADVPWLARCSRRILDEEATEPDESSS